MVHGIGDRESGDAGQDSARALHERSAFAVELEDASTPDTNEEQAVCAQSRTAPTLRGRSREASDVMHERRENSCCGSLATTYVRSCIV